VETLSAMLNGLMKKLAADAQLAAQPATPPSTP
jgi:hypothetical protein